MRLVALLLLAAVCRVSAAPDFEALAREKLAAGWEQLTSQVGAYKSVSSARVIPVPAQGVNAVDLTAVFEKTPFVIRLAFNDEGEIAGLRGYLAR